MVTGQTIVALLPELVSTGFLIAVLLVGVFSERSVGVAAALAEGWLGWKDLLPDGQGLPTEDGAVLAGAVYRCAAPGCGREVVEVRPTAAPQSGARLTCHGRQMERTGG